MAPSRLLSDVGHHARPLRCPSLLLLRGPVRPPAVRAQLILDNLPSFVDDLRSGAIVVIAEDRIRVRSLPVGD